MNNIETGKIGENLASKYLLDNKYLILAQNHREKYYEIDIIARRRDGLLIFCEVKTINNNGIINNGFTPEDNLSWAKRRKMIRASRIFLAKYPRLIKEDKGWQLDLIAVILAGGKLSDLRHYENI
jgi:putative endonuclease